MADSSSSQQSQLSEPQAARSRANRGKKSLVHASVFSLRDLLSEFGQAFPNLLHLDAYNYPSKLTQKDIDVMSKLFGIEHPYRAELPGPNDRACYPKPRTIRIYKETFYAGI